MLTVEHHEFQRTKDSALKESIITSHKSLPDKSMQRKVLLVEFHDKCNLLKQKKLINREEGVQ